MLMQIGKYFSQKKRIYLLWIGCLCSFFASLFIFQYHFQAIQELQNEFSHLEKMTLNTLQKRKVKKEFLERYSNCDFHMPIKFLNEKSFLNHERAKLQYYQKHPAFFDNLKLRQRKEVLLQNKLFYLCEDPIITDNIKEARIVLNQPVRCDFSDICEVLSKLDEVQIENYLPDNKFPQVIIYDLHIEKCLDNFSLDFKLLEREFFK